MDTNVNPNFGFFIALLCLIVFALLAVFFFAFWLKWQKDSPSPYSKMPMMHASELPYDSMIKILRFFYEMKDFDNRMFDLRKAGICRETRRIFPNCLTWYRKLRLDWTFLQKRYPGHYVSWGSLTESQQLSIIDYHESLDRFQTAISSPYSAPRDVTREYALTVPGPLYVDLETKVLLGWVVVPDTSFEVLVVQKRRKEHEFQVKFD